MRTTENLSIRIDPEVLRLARRTAEEYKQTLREFFEEAIRRQVATVTRPEESSTLLSTVEQALLNRLDQRLRDVLERVTALSAKEATDQAHALQLIKRVLLLQMDDRPKWQIAVNRAWEEAVERVQKRGRPVPPEVAEGLQAKVAELEKAVTEKTQAVEQTKTALEQARAEVKRLQQEIQTKERDQVYLSGQYEALDFALQRELWVAEQLERQGMNPIGRKSAAELRRLYGDRQESRRATPS